VTLEQRLNRNTVDDLKAIVWHFGDVNHVRAEERCKDPRSLGSKPQLISWMVQELKDELLTSLPIVPATLTDWRTDWHRVTDETVLARDADLRAVLSRRDELARAEQERKDKEEQERKAKADRDAHRPSVDEEARRIEVEARRIEVEARRAEEEAKRADREEAPQPASKRRRAGAASMELMTCSCGNVQPLASAMDAGCLKCGAAPLRNRIIHDFREGKHDDPAPGHVSSSQQVLLSPSQPALHQSPQQLLPSSSSRNIRAQLNPLDISLSRVPGAFLDLAPVASSILDKARAGQTYIPIDTLMPRKRSTPSATSSGLATDEYESVFALSSSNHLVRVAEGERLTMSVARSIDSFAGIVEVIVHQLIGVVYRDSPQLCFQLFGLLSVAIDVDRMYGWKATKLYVDSVLQQRLIREFDISIVQQDLLSNAFNQLLLSQHPTIKSGTTSASTTSSIGSIGTSATSDKSSKGVCWKFNSGQPCAKTPCPFPHVCRICQGNHRKAECTANKGTKSGKKNE
jgi:hypothetical protein